MAAINWSVDASVPVILAGAAFVIVVGFVVTMVLDKLNKTGRELDVTLRPFHFGTRAQDRPIDRTTEAFLGLALARLQDLEQGLNALVEADDTHLEPTGQNWFDFVCEGLASVLASGTHLQFRVAIWTDDEGDPDFLRGLAYHGFNLNDPKYEKLPRTTTLAGWAVAHREEHYAPDIDKCELFQRRVHAPRFRSMVASPLGPEANPWAVITVDAPIVDGLDEPRLQMVRRFGVLATVGASILRARSTTVTSTSGS